MNSLVALPIVAATPIAAEGAVDPIFSVIERHKAAAVVWDAAVEARSNFPDGPALETDEQQEELERLEAVMDDSWGPCEQAAIELLHTLPTTFAGAIAAIQYIRAQMKDDGTYMPQHFVLETGGDAQRTMGWLHVFLGTVADTVATLGSARDMNRDTFPLRT